MRQPQLRREVQKNNNGDDDENHVGPLNAPPPAPLCFHHHSVSLRTSSLALDLDSDVRESETMGCAVTDAAKKISTIVTVCRNEVNAQGIDA